eukprot:6468351-Prymnesium_polylepis.1
MKKAFSLEADVVSRDAERVRQRMVSDNKWLISEHNKYIRVWDAIAVGALLFTLLVTPYELGFLAEGSGPGLEMLNWGITFIFTVDILLTFIRPIRDKIGQKIKDHKVIAHTYIHGWLPLDLMSTIPFDTLFETLSGGGTSSAVRLTRIVR